jgi:uncharacterized protein (TIGR00255 family)
MIKSMTGFGKSIFQLPSKKITIEIKSLNSKNLDLNTRIPSIYKEKEHKARKLISNSLTRGKIDFSIFYEITGENTNSALNTPVIKKYIDDLKNITEGNEINFLEMALRLPDSISNTREELDENEWNVIEENISKALEDINSFRIDEGKSLEAEFSKRINNLTEILESVIKIDPERVEAVRTKLEKGISDLKENVDENRFEQELIYYIEKLDITEEKVRLKNHLEYFTTTLNETESNGKKLGFISQEIGREINTIGSKSNYAPMQKLVVQMKDELEKIKEQLLNAL